MSGARHSKSTVGPWRLIVAFTRKGPLYFAAFAAVAIGVPVYLGDKVMEGTNGPAAEEKLKKALKQHSSIDAQMLAKAQRERLQVLLDEVKDGYGHERYKAALEYVFVIILASLTFSPFGGETGA